MIKLHAAFVTNCTATRSVKPEIRGIDLPSDLTMAEALEEWCKRLKAEEPSITPAELYRGIGMNSVVQIAEMVHDRSCYIASAGQGLMHIDQKIIPYDFTSDPKHKDSIHKIVTKEPFVMTAWWRMINQKLYSNPHPVASLLEDDHNTLVVIACNSRFLKLLPEDILSTSPEDLQKVRLITTSRSASGIPKQLKPYVLYYDRRVSASTVGNRNDLNHRAAKHFFQLLADNTELLEANMQEQQAAIYAALGGTSEGTILDASSEVALQTLLEQNPALGEMSPDSAYAEVRSVHRLSVHPTKFRQMWSKMFNKSIVESGAKSVEDPAARAALMSIMPNLAKHTAQSVTWDEEKRALDLVGKFVGLLKEVDPNTRFTSTDVKAWAETYLRELDVQEPPQFQSSVKLSFLMKTYHEDLGLKVVSAGSKIIYAIQQ